MWTGAPCFAIVLCTVSTIRRPAPPPETPSRKETPMQKIIPFLWFNGQAEEAMNFYTSIFRNSKVLSVARYGDAGPGPKGSVMTAQFEVEGHQFVALNGGPQYTFTPAVSFLVNCTTQDEVDHL